MARHSTKSRGVFRGRERLLVSVLVLVVGVAILAVVTTSAPTARLSGADEQTDLAAGTVVEPASGPSATGWTVSYPVQLPPG